MGAINSRLESIINTILDIVVIKSGLVISEDYLLEILRNEYSGSEIFKNYIVNKERIVRIRSEDFDEYCWFVRKKLGELDAHASPLFTRDLDKYMEWQSKGYNIMGVYKRFFELAKKTHSRDNRQLIDPTPIIDKIISEKIAPMEVVLNVLENIMHNQRMSNSITPVEEILWDGGVDLSNLFLREHIPLSENQFIDQKLINYLSANPNKLEFMHWRNFERLTAEFFNRQNYSVELGPGTNDGGVDLRVYDKKDKKKPYIIIQCKRHKETHKVKIETVKSFFTDVDFEGAKKGLVATTSTITPGGKKVVAIRKYPLEFAENKEIKDWVNKMTKR
jgi:restriction system protein